MGRSALYTSPKPNVWRRRRSSGNASGRKRREFGSASGSRQRNGRRGGCTQSAATQSARRVGRRGADYSSNRQQHRLSSRGGLEVGKRRAASLVRSRIRPESFPGKQRRFRRTREDHSCRSRNFSRPNRHRRHRLRRVSCPIYSGRHREKSSSL